MPDALAAFERRFSRPPEADAAAPGRVNLIGEHTDYNEGFVLPVTIPQRTRVLAARRDDSQVRAHSSPAGEVSDALYTLGAETRTGTWIDYLQGVTTVLRGRGLPLGGVDLLVESDVPIGAGLSSSAALEVAALRALAALFRLDLSPLDIAQVAHEAETTFVGAPVGVMDQMVCSLGAPGEALYIDTRTLAVEPIPVPPLVELLVINSGITHAHASGEYRVRRAECDETARLLGVKALRDATPDLLAQAMLPPLLRQRARHVVTENERVNEMRLALRTANIPAAGALMQASHRSMRDDFEVSTPEVDTLVDLVQAMDGVAGARLTGGGFGGCVVALVARGRATDVGQAACAAYERQVGRAAAVLVP